MKKKHQGKLVVLHLAARYLSAGVVCQIVRFRRGIPMSLDEMAEIIGSNRCPI